MHIAILTFDAFNELDSLTAFGFLNRVKRAGSRVTLACRALAAWITAHSKKNISPYLPNL